MGTAIGGHGNSASKWIALQCDCYRKRTATARMRQRNVSIHRVDARGEGLRGNSDPSLEEWR
jgi:hypothetical protein